MRSLSVSSALKAVVSAIPFGLGSVVLPYSWILNVGIVEVGLRYGSSTLAAIYGGLPLQELVWLALTVRGARMPTTLAGREWYPRPLKILWLSNALNFVLVIPLAPALIFPFPSTTGTGPAYATSVLQDSSPDLWTSPRHDQFGGYARFTASELNRIHWGAQFGQVTYIPGDVPSTDPEIVSVNPIDNDTWGAAAYSVRAQRCDVILEVQDKSDPRYGHTFYGRLAPGAACVGQAATPWTATSTDVEPE